MTCISGLTLCLCPCKHVQHAALGPNLASHTATAGGPPIERTKPMFSGSTIVSPGMTVHLPSEQAVGGAGLGPYL